MATQAFSEVSSFHQFLTARLARAEPGLSLEECLREWRSELSEREATLAAVREGLEDVRAGRIKSLEEFDREFRQRHDIPRAT